MSKRVKAKGLLKLKFYCELCSKQCRDENGFKCHTMSDSHLRQMQLFGENPDKFIEEYSQKFEDSFLGHLKQSHGFSRVAATVVYNEYISDPYHVHMNATKWLSLTEFVVYLGETGKCKVDKTHSCGGSGWFITYHNDKSKRFKSKLMEEHKHDKEIAKQINRATSVAVPIPMEIEIEKSVDCELPDKHKKIAFRFGLAPPRRKETNKMKGKEDSEEVKDTKNNRKAYWLCEGIVVKVISKVWEEKGLYNKKGVVKKVLDNYIGEIQMLDTDTHNDHIVRINQDHLQTVLPHISGLVRIVNGSYCGCNARLLDVDTFNFCAKVQLDKCIYQGRVLHKVAYEDICKLAV